jgi:hypothetical protein
MAGITGILINRVSREEIAILHATGVPMAKRQIKLMTRTSIGAYSIELVF